MIYPGSQRDWAEFELCLWEAKVRPCLYLQLCFEKVKYQVYPHILKKGIPKKAGLKVQCAPPAHHKESDRQSEPQGKAYMWEGRASSHTASCWQSGSSWPTIPLTFVHSWEMALSVDWKGYKFLGSRPLCSGVALDETSYRQKLVLLTLR